MGDADNGLTPPGPPVDPAPATPAPAPVPVPAPGQDGSMLAGMPPMPPVGGPPRESTDTGLGWTSLGTALGSLCVPCLPLVAVVLAVITLVRKRFRPRWVPVVALVLGVALTVGQALLVPAFLDGIKEGIEDAANDRSDDAVLPNALRKGDCYNDKSFADRFRDGDLDEGFEASEKVTLVSCDGPHAYEVYKLIRLEDGKYPGRQMIQRRTDQCTVAFEKFVGIPYDDSRFEVLIHYPQKAGWNFANDRTITCSVTHPKGKMLKRSLRNIRR